MIVGVGLDLFDVGRMARELARQGSPEATGLFLPSEASAFGRGPRAAERLAAVFAAKEAVVKALENEGGDTGTWREVEVRPHAEGETIVLHGRARARAERLGITEIRVSTTRTPRFAAAAVVARAARRTQEAGA